MRCPRCQAKNPDTRGSTTTATSSMTPSPSTKRLFVSIPFILGLFFQTSPRQSWAWAWSGFPGEISEPHFEQARASRTPPYSQKLAATHENVGQYRAAIARLSPLTARRRS
jgi:hypothetical protein